MEMKNKQLYLVEKEKFLIKENEIRNQVKSDEVLIKSYACGICGTDISYAQISTHSIENKIILGHELVGKIIKVGSDVNDFEIGDVVVINPGLNCGKCKQCVEGNANLCKNIEFYGYPPNDGGLQTYMFFPARACYKLPIQMSPLLGVLVEPLAVSLHTLNISKIKYGMDVVIEGCGTIGATLIHLLRKSGAGKIIVSEPVAYRRKIAIEMGADYVINPLENNIVDVVNNITKGKGVERVFEVSGDNQALKDSVLIASQGAIVIIVGIPLNDDFAVSHSIARKKGLTFKMERTLRNTIVPAIEELTKDKIYEILIDEVWKMEDLVEKFDLVKNHLVKTTKLTIMITK